MHWWENNYWNAFADKTGALRQAVKTDQNSVDYLELSMLVE